MDVRQKHAHHHKPVGHHDEEDRVPAEEIQRHAADGRRENRQNAHPIRPLTALATIVPVMALIALAAQLGLKGATLRMENPSPTARSSQTRRPSSRASGGETADACERLVGECRRQFGSGHFARKRPGLTRPERAEVG